MFLVALLALAVAAILLAAFALSSSSTDESSAESSPEDTAVEGAETPETEDGEAPAPPNEEAADDAPESVKGIYLTAASANNLEPYLDLIERTELNAAVVDVKDVTGEVMYPSEVPLAGASGATRDILDIESLAAELEERGIYAIARVAVFEDAILPIQRPDLAVTDSATGAQWQNNVGSTWTDPHSREVWEYNVGVAREAAEAGFDEIQFDYVRFPSDGPMETLSYPSENDDDDDTIASFLEYAKGELEPSGARVAADVFGLASGDGGAGVGQNIREMAPHLDVINPMVYPSHFPVGSYGLDNPNANPYEVIENAMADFEADAEASNPDLEIRPWLQDFDYGEPPYGPAEVEAQIQATYDSGETGWLLWNPSNVYTEEALGGGDSASGGQYDAE
ncbi:MAG: putative glycoside hydrolase [Rubrobacter sp.]|nr:putative glycoside hydrolase [Rubrobacter sp.]